MKLLFSHGGRRPRPAHTKPTYGNNKCHHTYETRCGSGTLRPLASRPANLPSLITAAAAALCSTLYKCTSVNYIFQDMRPRSERSKRHSRYSFPCFTQSVVQLSARESELSMPGVNPQKSIPTRSEGAHSPCRTCTPTFAKKKRGSTAEQREGKEGPSSAPRFVR